MYYKILINGKEVGVFGHEDICNIYLSVGGEPGEMYVFASAVCREGEKKFHYDWLQEEIGIADRVEIVPTDETNAREPRKKFLMGHPKRAPSEGKVCDFCQRKETEAEQLIYVAEHRPSICSDCVALCNEILKKKV